MKRSHQLPDGYCFPTPPGRIDRDLERTPFLPAVAHTYFIEIQRWRDAVATALAESDRAIAQVENLSPKARARLAMLLRLEWNAAEQHWADRTGYDLTPFPAAHRASRGDHPMEVVLEALHWRAAVVNYLTDAWDLMGKPDLKMGECAAIGMFMRPVRLEGRCVYCLTEYGPGRIDPAVHDCVMTGHVHSV